MGNLFEYINADGLGDFGYPGNWIDETSPYVFGPPGPTDIAIVEAPGTISGTASVSELALIGAYGVLTSTLEFTTQSLVLEGSVALSDRDYSEVTGEVEEAGASTVTLTGGELYVDNPSGGNGYNAYSGISGTTVFDIGLNKGDQSTFNLSGAATTVLVEAGNTVIGDAGSGAMTISSGAELHDLGWLILGGQPGANGYLTVTGASSSLIISGTLLVGDYGESSLSVLSGGLVDCNQLNTNGGPNGASGSIVVSGAGSQLIATQAYIGSAQPGSSLTIANGGFADVNDLGIGETAGGTVLVEGPGSMLKINGTLDWSYPANASFQVTSGAQAVLQTADPVGLIALVATATVSVLGAGSIFRTTSGTLYLGSSGGGAETVTIGSGGKMITSTTGGPAVVVGSTNDPSNGNVLTTAVIVDGPGSNWSVTGEFDVDYDASLLVEGAGGLETDNSSGIAGFAVGSQSGSTGTATITGTGSTLTNSGGFLIGDAGSGTLTISSGAVVSTTTSATAKFFGVDGAVIGDASGSNGQVDVTGAGSKWAIGADLVIGQSGTGALMIGSGAQVSVGGPAELNNGHLLLTGGNLSVAKTFSVTTGQLVSGQGTIQVSSLINSGTLDAAGGTLSFIGGITGTGTLQIDLGATLSLGSSVGSGQETVFESATSKLVLGAPASFASTIYDFIKGDTIDLSKIIASSLTYSGQALTVHESNGASLALKFAGTYALSNFGMTTDGHSGTFITHT